MRPFLAMLSLLAFACGGAPSAPTSTTGGCAAGACVTSADCCAGFACGDGSCQACASVGASCGGDGCCPGLTCESAVCVAPGGTGVAATSVSTSTSTSTSTSSGSGSTGAGTSGGGTTGVSFGSAAGSTGGSTGTTGGQQTCVTGSDCASGCCAPATDSNGEPVGPYICKPDDGADYDCCHGFIVCGDPYCCFEDTNGNEFCAAPCTGPGTCGAASCNTYDNLHTTCTGTLGCGP